MRVQAYSSQESVQGTDLECHIPTSSPAGELLPFPSSKTKCSDAYEMLWKRGCEFLVAFLTASVPGGSPEEQNTVPVSSHVAQHLG